MVIDLTGLEIANASLLDEATAAAEAMTMCHAIKDGANIFFVSETCHPQTIDVVKTRAAPLGIEVVVGDHRAFRFGDRVVGALVQYPPPTALFTIIRGSWKPPTQQMPSSSWRRIC
jgi:glycine dehydrogenase